jgi:hypothetical protein
MPANDTTTSRFAGGAQQAQAVDPAQAKLREDAARQALLDAGRADFPRIGKLVRNGYSEDLERRGEQVTKYMRREQGENARAAYVDPNQFMVGVALGMKDSDIAGSILQQQGVSTTPEAIGEVAENMRAEYRFPYNAGQTTETHAPHVSGIDYFSTAPKVCVIVPPSAYYPSIIQIPGLSREQNLDFINLHESWHCRDTRNNFVGLDKTQLNSIDLHHPERAIGNPDQLKAYVVGLKQESLADVGAMSEMIRKGANPKIIDGLIEWRRTQGDDQTHMSVAALQDLRRTIDTMGVRDFRRLNDDKARELYNDIAARNAPSPETMEKIIAYTAGTAQERTDMLVLQRDNPDMQKAIDYMKGYQLPPPKDQIPPAPTGPQPLTPQEQGIFEMVRQYDAAQRLQDRAFKEDKKITPETLVKAYRAEQRDLMRQLDRSRGDAVVQAKLEKLDESFVHTVQSLDYIAANAARGVDITRDKALSGITLPPTVAPQPEPEPQPGPERQPGPAETAGGIASRARPVMGM